MNDNQITDDLLEELEELESSAVELDQQLGDAQDKKATLDKLDSPNSIDATSLAMEAAKMAQDAASHSQKAAEASLNHASRQKEQIMELSDANFAWRQAVKSATKEISSAKSQFAILLGVGIVTSVTAMSVMGWMLYSIQQKEDSFKGEILDILQTENALLTKQITIKVDELSGLIELMTADIQKINKMGMAIQENIVGDLKTAEAENPTASTPPQSDVILDLASEVAPEPHSPHAPENGAAGKDTHELVHQDATPTQMEHSPKDPEDHVTVQHSQPVATKSEEALSSEHYLELKGLIQKILDAQHKLEAQTMASTASHSGSGLTTNQEKQLKDISWLVRKQSKTLEQIQKSMSLAPETSDSKKLDLSTSQTQKTYNMIRGSLIELKDQLNQLKAQQTQLQSQVDSLQKETKKLSDAAKPYSYQIKQ